MGAPGAVTQRKMVIQTNLKIRIAKEEVFAVRAEQLKTATPPSREWPSWMVFSRLSAP
jgi:hypothetical protein